MAKKRRSLAIAVAVMAGAAVVGLMTAHLSVYRVNGRSMEPAYSPSDVLLVESMTFRLRSPRRFEVVVVRDPIEPGRLDLKRIVALPAETVASDGGHLLVNGSECILPAGLEMPSRFGPVETADGFFVLGDNWRHSRDSRDYGPLKRLLVVGRVAGRLYRNSGKEREYETE